MKSVKILSEELGVSKQTIFNNIKRLNIETIKQANTSFIKENADIEKIIQRVNKNKKKYGFENTTEDKQKKDTGNSNIESKSDTHIVEILKKQIDILNDQIEKQESRHETTIEFYRKELQERSKLLENQQILALESNKKIQKLEHQLEEERQLNDSFNKSTNDRKNIDVQKTPYTSDSVNMDQYQKEEKEPDFQHKDILEENKNESIEEDRLSKDNKPSKEIKNDLNVKKGVSKKGFWSRLFGN